MFRTTGDLIRHHFFELLEDGQEHSAKEIANYVFEETGGVDIAGERLSDTTIHNAIWYHIRKHEALYVQTRRGYYRKNTAEAMLSRGGYSLYGKSLKILDEAAESIRDCFATGAVNTIFSPDELKTMHELEKSILECVAKAKEEIMATGGQGNE